MDAKKIGQLIRALREEKSMTQEQLAKLLKVSDKAVSKWESGGGLPDTPMFPEMAKTFGVTIDELMAGEKNQIETVEFNATFQPNLTVEELIKRYDIYEEYEKGNWAFIERIIDSKKTATELYSVKDLSRWSYDQHSDSLPRWEFKDGTENHYRIAQFFNEDYPEVLMMLIRMGKGIPENRPGNSDGGISPGEGQKGISFGFIRALFESMVDRIDELEEEIEKLKNKD